VLQGEGEKAFSAGADITEFNTSRATFEQVVRFHEETVGACLTEMGDCPIPVVAKIRGVCMGGGLELASMCDIRIADEGAKFGAPVGKLGFPLAFGETQALFNLVGSAVAAELLIEGKVLTSSEAQSRGIVTRLSPTLSLDSEVERAVFSICQSGIWAARSHKRQLRRLMRDASPVSEQERKEVYAFVHTEEYRKGIERFVHGRKGNG
jgi:enoyl-CoA hydratase/carnithine racemase